MALSTWVRDSLRLMRRPSRKNQIPAPSTSYVNGSRVAVLNSSRASHRIIFRRVGHLVHPKHHHPRALHLRRRQRQCPLEVGHNQHRDNNPGNLRRCGRGRRPPGQPRSRDADYTTDLHHPEELAGIGRSTRPLSIRERVQAHRNQPRDHENGARFNHRAGEPLVKTPRQACDAATST